MKKKNLYFLAIIVLFTTVSCKKDVRDWSKAWVSSVPHYLSVSQNSLYFEDATGGKQIISVKAPNTAWEITDLPEWLSVDKLNGTGDAERVVFCSANPSPTNARATFFTIRSVEEGWDYSISIFVSQVRSPKYATPSATQALFEGKAGRQTITVTSNVDDWGVSASSSWLTTGKGADGKSIDISVTPNPNNTSRTAYVTLKTDDTEQQITVMQRAGNISATLDRLTYEHEASSQKVTITSDAPWTAQTASSWIEAVPSSADAGTTEVTIRTLANNSFDTRSGYVYFVMADDNKVELPIEQGAIYFSLSTSSLEFPHSASTKTITITTNAEWELTSDLPDWLTVSTREGKGDTEVEVSAKEYQSESVLPRYATLTYKPRTIDRAFEITVSQTGQELNLSSMTLQFTNKRGSLSLSLDATGAWSASSSADWITLSPSCGDGGKAECQVSVDENTGDDRSCEIIFSFYETSQKVLVTQQGVFLTLSTDGLQFGSIGGKLRIDISSNTSWEASVNDGVDWLNVSPEKGEDSESLFVIAADNPSANGRNGTAVVTPSERQPLYVSVSQASRYLNLSTGSIDFLAPGGTSELITVDTDGEIIVTTESDWLTINMVGNKSFTITASKSSSYRTGVILVSLANLISGKIEKNILVIQSNMRDGHNYVDLGLPSGLLWAAMNVGATVPEDYGDYFAWGETTPKSDYSWTTYEWCNGSFTSLTQYNTDSDYGTVDNKTVLDHRNDAAAVNWGGGWHIPTADEWMELCKNCTWAWTTQGGSYGYRVKSNVNGSSIFLPAAGYRFGTSRIYEVSRGYYWSSSLDESSPHYAWRLGFTSDYVGSISSNARQRGHTVRPVCRP